MAVAQREAGTAGKQTAKEPSKKTDSGKKDAAPRFDKAEELAAYREMLLIRRFEEKAGQMYGMGLIGGFCHLYIGQEAVVVGMQMATKEGDQVITGYRDHGTCWPAAWTQGRHGRADRPPRRLLAGQGRLHAHVLQGEALLRRPRHRRARRCRSAPGIAFANSTARTAASCLTYFGDGRANQGQVYESFNMAELWKLPVVYVIENNRYAMGTSVTRSSAQTDFSKRGVSVQHPRRAGRRHGCARRARGRGPRPRIRSLGPGAIHP
jgi:pyruvate dehydrogenase E1 component alpha subunit